MIKLIIFLIALIIFIIVLLSSLINLYDNKSRLINFFSDSYNDNKSYLVTKDDLYWAKEIMKGGYILHFRHAERDKWIDVQMYDALESDLHINGIDESRYAEYEYFKDAVCLNQRGLIQAQAMGEHIKKIGLPIGKIVSSVSCRARQTAELAFGKYDSLHRVLVHIGPYNEKHEERITNLKNFYNDLDIYENTNTVVSAHNGVIDCDMFVNKKCNNISLEEGGFYIISKSENGLNFEYEFNNYNYFNRIFYER